MSLPVPPDCRTQSNAPVEEYFARYTSEPPAEVSCTDSDPLPKVACVVKYPAA